MMGLYLLVVAVVFALVIHLIMVYIRRIAEVTLTDQFRAAESITNGNFPEKWRTLINRRLAERNRIPVFNRKASGAELALGRMDSLIRFFEKSPFFENAETRELLLAQLKNTRQRWAALTWEEIEKENQGSSSSDDQSV